MNSIVSLRRSFSSPAGSKKGKSAGLLSPRFHLNFKLLLLIVVCLIFLGGGIVALQATQKENKSEIKGLTTNILEHKILTVVVWEGEQNNAYKYVKQYAVLFIKENSQDAVLINIDTDYLVRDSKVSRLKFPIKNAINLANTAKQDMNEVLIKTGNDLLGVSMNEMIVMESKDFNSICEQIGCAGKNIQSLIGKIHQTPSLLLQLGYIFTGKIEFKNLVTSTSFLDLMGSINNMKTLKTEEFKDNYGLAVDSATGRSYEPDATLITEYVSAILKSNNIIAEQAKIEILNASEVSGIAGRYSRVLTNYGVNVINYNNAPKPSKVSRLFVDQKFLGSRNLSLIKSIININNIEIVPNKYEFSPSSDITIILGSDVIS